MGAPEVVSIGHDPDAVVKAPAAVVGRVADDMPVLVEDGGVAAPVRQAPTDFPPNAVLQDDGSVKLTLEYPKSLQWKDGGGSVRTEPYKVLHMKRLNGKKMRELQNAAKDMFPMVLLALTTDMSLARADILYDVLDAADLATVLKVGLFFIAPDRKR